jgi:hypothetical protein
MDTYEAIDATIRAHGALAVVRACDRQMRCDPGALEAIGLSTYTLGDVVRIMWRAQDALTPAETKRVAEIDRRRLAAARCAVDGAAMPPALRL